MTELVVLSGKGGTGKTCLAALFAVLAKRAVLADCVDACSVQAIDFPERVAGTWIVSASRCGPLVHARLVPAGENSGKLVAMVRQTARRLATEQGRPLIIVDGPPGID